VGIVAMEAEGIGMKKLRFMAALLLLLVLTGCWDKLELEEQAYTVVLGIDLIQDDRIRVTFQIANPQVGSSDTGAAQNEPPSDIVSFVAPDVLSAKELANSVITRKISFANLRTLIVSEQFAKSPLFHPIISAAVRDPEMRRETNVIVSKETALEFIQNNKPRLETRPHKYFAFMQERWRDTGFVPFSTLNRYLSRLGEGSLYLAMLATTKKENTEFRKNEDQYFAGQVPQSLGDPVQIMGSAVFKKGQMISKLSGEETRMILLLRRKSIVKSYIATYEDPLDKNLRLSIRLIKDGKTQIHIEPGSNKTRIRVTVPLTMQLLSVPSMINYTMDQSKQDALTESIQAQLEESAHAIIRKAQDEFKGDPFLWYLNARVHFLTRRGYTKYDWETQFAQADVKVEFQLKLQSFGKQLQSPKIEKGAGSE
jgi:spore germination protein KC